MATLAAIPDPALKQAWSRLLVACSLSLLLHLALLLGIPVNPAGGVPNVVSLIYARLEPSVPAAAADSGIAAPETARAPADKTPLPASAEAKPKAAETKAGSKPATAPAPGAGLELPLLRDPAYYPASQLDVYPRPLAPIRLPYPQTAAAGRVDGRLSLLLLIDESGAVTEVSVVAAEPAGYFEEAARSVFRSARFSPGMQQGRAVKSRVLLQIKYVHSDSAGAGR
jgi:protein TonB